MQGAFSFELRNLVDVKFALLTLSGVKLLRMHGCS